MNAWFVAGCLLFVVIILVAAVLFIWWNLPCAEGD